MISTSCASSCASSKASNSARFIPSWLFAQVGMPSRFASTSPRASGTFEATRASLYVRSGSRRLCSDNASMLEPRPEISTATRTGSAMMGGAPCLPRGPALRRSGDGTATLAGLDGANREDSFSSSFKFFSYVLHITAGNQKHHADAAVESTGELAGLDIPLGLQEGHQPRLQPGPGVDLRMQPLRQHPRHILQQAAAGDMGQRVYLPSTDHRQQAL